MRRTAALVVLMFTVLAGCADSPRQAAAPVQTPSHTSAARSSAPAASGSRTVDDVDSATVSCVRGTVRILSAAIADWVARRDIGSRYAKATRQVGNTSEPWRLASVLFPPVYAKLQASGATDARRTAQALAIDACSRLHGNQTGRKAPDLSGAQPITIPGQAPAPAAASPSPLVPRSCHVLEERPRPFSGHWLTLDHRGLYQDEVRMVQSQLNWLGYGCTPEDGDYGPETEGLVRQFQSDRGLVVDGKVGPQTWGALFGPS